MWSPTSRSNPNLKLELILIQRRELDIALHPCQALGAGDQILPSITTNVSTWHIEPEFDAVIVNGEIHAAAEELVALMVLDPNS